MIFGAFYIPAKGVAVFVVTGDGQLAFRALPNSLPGLSILLGSAVAGLGMGFKVDSFLPVKQA